jgi:hypothetical protein
VATRREMIEAATALFELAPEFTNLVSVVRGNFAKTNREIAFSEATRLNRLPAPRPDQNREQEIRSKVASFYRRARDARGSWPGSWLEWIRTSITKPTRLAAAMREETELREIQGFMRAPHVTMLIPLTTRQRDAAVRRRPLGRFGNKCPQAPQFGRCDGHSEHRAGHGHQ